MIDVLRVSSILLVTVILFGGLGFVGNLGVVHAVDITGINDPYSWSMFGGNSAHSGYSLSIGPGKFNQLLYNMTIVGGYNATYSTPVISGERIYIVVSKNDGAELRCFDSDSASLFWMSRLGNACVTPAVSDNFVFAGLENGTVCAFDVVTGRSMWSHRVTNASFSPVTVEGGRVYAASEDGDIYCFNEQTGLVYWSQNVGDVPCSPSVISGRIYVGSADSKVYCLDASSGISIWNYSANAKVQSCIAIVDDRAYFTCDNGKGYCLDATSGQSIWNRIISNDAQMLESFCVANGRIYMSIDDQVCCFDANTGVQIWSNTLDSNGLPPAVADGKVYVNSLNYTYCLDAITGVVVWDFRIVSKGFSVSPAVGDNKLLLVSCNGYLLGFRAPNNKVTFTQSGLPSGTSWSVTITRWDNLSLSSTSSRISFPVYAGEYNFSITPISGYDVSYSENQTTNLMVNKADVNIPIIFTAQIPVVPEESNWTIISVAICTATIAAMALAGRAEKKTSHKYSKRT